MILQFFHPFLYLKYLLEKVPRPTTLQEAVAVLERMMTKDEKKLLQTAKDKKRAASTLHHTLGRHIRNEWCLWHASDLALHLKEVYGIEHPDDMSHAIIMAYCNSIVK